MGTRSLTVFVDGESEIAVLYRQMDGYPSGQGLDLAQYLSGRYVCNGYGPKDEVAHAFNGMHDLAVRTLTALTLKLKGEDGGDWDRPGSLYLYPAKTRDCGEEYVYYVSAAEGKIRIKACYPGDAEPFFDGSPEEFSARDWDKS